VRVRQIFGWALISIGIIVFFSMLAAREKNFLNLGVIFAIIFFIALPLIFGIRLLLRAKKMKIALIDTVKETAPSKKMERVVAEPAVYEAGMPFIGPSSNCPSCQAELLPISFGYSCAHEGKFFGENLKEIPRPYSSLPFVLATRRKEITILAPKVINGFLGVFEKALHNRHLPFQKISSEGSEGFSIKTSSLWTYTKVLCEQDGSCLRLRFSHVSAGGLVRFLLFMLFIIPGVIASVLAGSEMKKNNLNLDYTVLQSLEELRSQIRSQVQS